jgi:hypothetical protein
MTGSLPNGLRSDRLKYCANPPKYDVAEAGDQASAPAQDEPKFDLEALLRLSRMSPGQRAREERRVENQEAHARRQAEVNELARVIREARRAANRRAFAARKRRGTLSG